MSSLARELNERGVVCPSGADPERNAHRSGERWIVRTVAMILENPRYTGRQVWNRNSTTGHGPGGRTGVRGSGALRWKPVSEWEVSERFAARFSTTFSSWEKATRVKYSRLAKRSVERR
ncbi:recombinase [Lentzea flaviverrucosa]|uniref:Recombinase n=1 Tax=Lentzea flaviverrucosa TaxID=200379 RepID=A0A1H9BJG7_9PSEU|nr:recombinase [Lentzea flaviverrucosa]SEP89055.1 Recombinase [Lentzea flaviverrucosa]